MRRIGQIEPAFDTNAVVVIFAPFDNTRDRVADAVVICGHRIPIEALFQRPTVRGIAEVIQRKLELSAGAMVPLHKGGTQPPLFLIAGAGGHVFAFHKFARLLGPDYPSYGMKAIGVDGAEPPLDRIEEIASRYVKEITAECPEGPYIIGGYSIGGRIALEVGLQLQALGKRVPRLVIFDMFAPGSPKQLPLSKRLVLHAKKLGSLPWREKVAYLRDRYRNFRNRIRNGMDIYDEETDGFPGLEMVPQQTIHDVWNALLRANDRYWPKAKYQGKVVLLVSQNTPGWTDAIVPDPTMGWTDWSTEPVEVRRVAGEHMELFKDEHQEKLAAIVRTVVHEGGVAAAEPALVG